MTNNMSWSFFQVWNESLEQREERPIKTRNNLWASELGKSDVDLYLKMKGVKPSNPFDARSLRKFEAGNIWEWIVGLVLKRAGVLMDTQEWVSHQYPGLLEVTGKLDYLAGGSPDWEKAQFEIHELGLPETLEKASERIISHFYETYPQGLKPIVLEIKSCAGTMFDRYSNSNQASANHRLQAFHYIKAKDMPEAHIVYISKDDCRMLEIGVMNPSAVESEYKNTIGNITEYIKRGDGVDLQSASPLTIKTHLNDIGMKIAPEIEFSEDFGKFSLSWQVKYSGYLTLLYGYENQAHFDNEWKKEVTSWNRVLGRIVRGDKMTDKNLEIISRIKSRFSDFDEVVQKVKSSGVIPEESEDENA
jgi:hypothetical protein